VAKTQKSTPASSKTKQQSQSTPLDEKITNLIGDAAKLVRKTWLPVVILIGAIAAIVLIVGLLDMIHRAREEALADRLSSIISVDPSEEKGVDFSNQESQIDGLIQDARGSGIERQALKDIVSYLQKKISAQGASASATGNSGEETTPDHREISRILDKIEEIAQLGGKRFEDDMDMKAWSENVRSWIQAERDFRGKVREKRAFSPVLPKESAQGKTQEPSPPDTKAVEGKEGEKAAGKAEGENSPEGTTVIIPPPSEKKGESTQNPAPPTPEAGKQSESGDPSDTGK